MLSLHSSISVRKMEAEVVSMCVNMFNGDENCCGTVSIPFLSSFPLRSENLFVFCLLR